jgi:hypothetical protein
MYKITQNGAKGGKMAVDEVKSLSIESIKAMIQDQDPKAFGKKAPAKKKAAAPKKAAPKKKAKK